MLLPQEELWPPCNHGKAKRVAGNGWPLAAALRDGSHSLVTLWWQCQGTLELPQVSQGSSSELLVCGWSWGECSAGEGPQAAAAVAVPRRHSKWVIEGRREAEQAAAAQCRGYQRRPPSSPVRGGLHKPICKHLLAPSQSQSPAVQSPLPCVTASSTPRAGAEDALLPFPTTLLPPCELGAKPTSALQALPNLGCFCPAPSRAGQRGPRANSLVALTLSCLREPCASSPPPLAPWGGRGWRAPLPCEPACSNPGLSQQPRAVSPHKALPPVPGHCPSVPRAGRWPRTSTAQCCPEC